MTPVISCTVKLNMRAKSVEPCVGDGKMFMEVKFQSQPRQQSYKKAREKGFSCVVPQQCLKSPFLNNRDRISCVGVLNP